MHNVRGPQGPFVKLLENRAPQYRHQSCKYIIITFYRFSENNNYYLLIVFVVELARCLDTEFSVTYQWYFTLLVKVWCGSMSLPFLLLFLFCLFNSNFLVLLLYLTVICIYCIILFIFIKLVFNILRIPLVLLPSTATSSFFINYFLSFFVAAATTKVSVKFLLMARGMLFILTTVLASSYSLCVAVGCEIELIITYFLELHDCVIIRTGRWLGALFCY